MEVEFPEKLLPIFEPRRYKVLYGGRGGSKSWAAARALLILGYQKPLRILCAREFQNSVADSVHALLKDQIVRLGLQSFYEVQKTTILGKNGTSFVFDGLRNNITSLKSFEGADICWVEEAQTVSRASWNVLIPTIRKEGSEIWVTFNPELETDETYQRFVAKPPEGALVLKVGWQDNPWFNSTLRSEMMELKARDPDSYLTVWEGHCRQTLDGAVYAKEIRAATEENRITRVPVEPGKPIHTFWDLGRSDNTSIWFAQIVGFEFRIVDYYQANQHAIGHYLEVLDQRRYVYGTHWLPHDAANKQLHHPLSIEGQMRAAGKVVRIVPKISVANGINAARTVFPKCWFDAAKAADGLQCLRHYQYEVDPATQQFSREPLHNWASHGADAFRYLAVALKETKPASAERPAMAPQRLGQQGGAWMS
jgi:phage terminase large subunit